jgi:hypothetical protein
LSLINTYALSVPGSGIVTADFSGDGNLDLVMVGTDPITGDWSYSVLLGEGDGSLKPPVHCPQSVTATVIAVVVADFNNDGKPGIAITAGNQTVAVLLGNGNGTFVPRT